MGRILLILVLILPAICAPTQRFPLDAGEAMAEQRRKDTNMQLTRTEKVRRKANEENRCYNANGLKVLFQNGDNKKNMFGHIGIIENLLNRVPGHPHVFFMCKNLPEDTLLDRGDEIYVLGIDSSTTDSDLEPAQQ